MTGLNYACRLEEHAMGKGILLWLLGVPIPVIIIIGFVFHWW
jgi:hypothetical protein